MKKIVHKRIFQKPIEIRICVMSGFESAHRQAETRTALKSSLSQWSSHRQETARCCWVFFRHFLKPRLLHMGESQCRFIQITWYSYKGRIEREEEGEWGERRDQHRCWLRPHTDQTHTRIKHTRRSNTASQLVEPSKHAAATVSSLLSLLTQVLFSHSEDVLT